MIIRRLFQAGDGRGRAGLVGLQKISTTAVGNVGAGEDNLISLTLEAKTLYKNTQTIRITAFGKLAANGNNKQVKLYFGATVVAQTAVVTSSDDAFELSALVIRTGALTQIACGRGSEDAFVDPIYSEPAETCASDITVKVTGEGVATDDIICKALLIEVLSR